MKSYLRKILSISLVLVVLLTNLAGCAPKEPAAPAASPGEKPAETPAGPAEKPKQDTLTVAFAIDPATMDPHAASSSPSVNALQPIYETLARYDENGQIQPLLAESWEVIDAYTTKINLRKGVKFHNGEEMKASDVLFSFKRAAGPDGVKVQYIMSAIDADNCEVVDDYTIIIKTHDEFAPLVGYLPYIGAVIVSEKEFTADAAKASGNPVGTGPFKFVEWRKNDRVIYVRNEDYWGEKPAYENLIMRTIVEANSRVIELESGNVDIAVTIPAIDIPRLENDPNVEILRNNSTQFEYYLMNTQKAPLDNVELRRAIDLAINEDDILASVYRGTAIYTPGTVTPNMKYYDDSDTEVRYNPEEAKKIIKDLGLEGATLKMVVSEAQARIDSATIIQSMLSEVGLNLDIQVFEAATVSGIIETGDFDLSISGWGAVGFPEPDNNIFGPFHSRQIPVNNYSYYNNPEMDALLEAQRATPDGPEREKLVKDVQKLLRKDVPAVPYANIQQIAGVRSNVKGFMPTPAASHFYHKAYFE